MTPRRLIVLLAAAVVVVVGAVWVSSQRHREYESTAGATVLSNLRPALNDITEVRLYKGDGTKTTLQKRDGEWIVAERNFPADAGRVRKLLIDLSALSIVEEKTREPESYAVLGVEDVDSPEATGTRVEAVTPTATYELIVGKPAGAKSNYVRVADSPVSVLATPQLSVESDPGRWLDQSLVDIDQARVREVVVRPVKGRAYTVMRESTEQTDFTVPNLPRGRKIASAHTVNSMANGLDSLTLDDVRPLEGSEDKSEGTPTATFRTFDGLEVTLNGRESGEDHFITLTARFDPEASKAQTQKAMASVTAAKGENAQTETANEDGAKAEAAKIESVKAETAKLHSRVNGREFKIPGYKYDALFRPLDELLEQS